MEKMKMNVGTMVALVLVAAAVSGLVINFGMVYAGFPQDIKANIEAEVELEQDGANIAVEVKAKGLTGATVYTVRAYSDDFCGTFLALIGSQESFGNGRIDFDATILSENLFLVNSVSIRGPGLPGPIAVCFQNIND